MIKDDFLKYQAQTSLNPLLIEVSKAKGSYIYNQNSRPFLDFVAGVSVCTLGHCHPKVVNAIKQQVESYMHVMVYGEYLQKPTINLLKLLTKYLPKSLQMTYLVNSGTEAVEGALKLSKIVTGRSQIIAAHRGYHGSTQGSMSVMGFEDRKQDFRPLIPGVQFIKFNDFSDIEKITTATAAIILETIQGGAGFILPNKDYFVEVRKRCNQTETLLIIDEVQSGFGRTGKLFAFEHYGITPDILVVGKGMASGMPIGAFISSRKIMLRLQSCPKLGHITTFGGHPVVTAAALATLKELIDTDLMATVYKKEFFFRKKLSHPIIKEIRGKGLMLAIIVDTPEIAHRIILDCLNRGLILFWLLFEPCAIRITPPLTISEEEICKGIDIILEVLDQIFRDGDD